MLLCGAHRRQHHRRALKRAQEEKSWGSVERQAKLACKGAWEIVAGPCCSREKTDTHSTATYECASALLPSWPPLHQCKSPTAYIVWFLLFVWFGLWSSPHRCRPISVVSRVGVISPFEKWFEWEKWQKSGGPSSSSAKSIHLSLSLLFLSCSMLLWWPGI